MLHYLMIAGPPFDIGLWAAVEQRIGSQGHTTQTLAMFIDGDGSLNHETDRIAHAIESAQNPVVLIAHGAAIPAAIEASRKHAPSGFVVSNGPISSIDRFTRGLIQWASLPSGVTEKLISPTLAMSILSSSIGLRRLVVNPYVMDHDTTVTVCGPIFEDKARLGRMRRFIKDLTEHTWPAPPRNVQMLFCRGDSDPLTICNYDTLRPSLAQGSMRDPVPGGRYLHPIERPWELADRSMNWADKNLTTT